MPESRIVDQQIDVDPLARSKRKNLPRRRGPLQIRRHNLHLNLIRSRQFRRKLLQPLAPPRRQNQIRPASSQQSRQRRPNPRASPGNNRPFPPPSLAHQRPPDQRPNQITATKQMNRITAKEFSSSAVSQVFKSSLPPFGPACRLLLCWSTSVAGEKVGQGPARLMTLTSAELRRPGWSIADGKKSAGSVAIRSVPC